MRKIDEITAIAEGRLKALHEKAEEARREQARAEKAEEALATAQHLFEAMRENANGAVALEGEAIARAEKAEADLAQHRTWHAENMNQIARDGERIKGLEARLAEVAPVIAAAEAQLDADTEYARQGGEAAYSAWSLATGALEDAVVKMRAGRVGKGGEA